jgi:D-alanyl-D-alanine carboxypeptidase
MYKIIFIIIVMIQSILADDMHFLITEIPSDLKQNMIRTKVWTESAPVKMEDLRLVTVDHYDFNGEVAEGKIVVHKKIAENTKKIFEELFAIKFPIEKIKTIDEYEGDDNKSMEDNNSSCFNYRVIAGSNALSMHAYGLAIDINPVQNPYIITNGRDNEIKIYPDQAREFMNRNNLRQGMVEQIVTIFTKHGFQVWGGNWHSPIDYQHFQFVPNTQVEEFIKN